MMLVIEEKNERLKQRISQMKRDYHYFGKFCYLISIETHERLLSSRREEIKRTNVSIFLIDADELFDQDLSVRLRLLLLLLHL